jgi:hypothetical protein
MCISYPLHCFFGCGSFGFEFEFKVQKHLNLQFFLSFSLSHSLLGRPISLSSFLSLLFLPCTARPISRSPFSLPFSSSSPAGRHFFPRPMRARSPAHDLPLPHLSFPFLTRPTSRRPAFHPARAPSPSFSLSLSRADRRGPPVRPFISPPPRTGPDSNLSPAHPPCAFSAVSASSLHANALRGPPISAARTLGVFPQAAAASHPLNCDIQVLGL